ncbi:MAG: class II aldolase/adducin family protein, partial [Nitrospina sp.]|nr:class II aldolase/adducin family protein [Nitrospina sp.]
MARELALRVYTSRIIGQDPDLVMHGGGNTSVKLRARDVFGDEVDVIHIKGSGWDLGTIAAAGLPAVRMAPLMRLRGLPWLSDEEMVNVQRSNLLDSTAPNPSVETLLHAYLPQKYVDHTHATAMLALANLPEVEAATREIFGERMALVPYVMPGFALAKLAAETFEAHPDAEGLLLVNHGHFAWGPDAKSSY